MIQFFVAGHLDKAKLHTRSEENHTQHHPGNNNKMKILMMLLFLFYPSFTESTSCEVQEKFQNAVGAIGAAIGEIPILSTAVNLADVYLEYVLNKF